MVPPSDTAAVAVSDTVVGSSVSAIAVTAGAGLMFNVSKPPPVALASVTDTVPASTYTSSAGAGTVTVPVVAPVAMVITAPLDSVTFTGASAGVSSEAV